MIRGATLLLALAGGALADDVRLVGPEPSSEEAIRFRVALVEALEGAGHRVLEAGEAPPLEVRARLDGHRLVVELQRGDRFTSADLDRYVRPEPDRVLPLLADLGLELGRGRRSFVEGAWAEAILADPDWPWPRLALARTLRQAGDVDGAARALDDLLARAPTFAPAWNERAILRYQADRLDDAAADLERALSLAPDSPDVCQNLSTLLWKNLETERALELARRAVEIKPDYHQGWYNLGNCHYLDRRFDEAAGAYRRAIELSPRFAQARSMLGKAFYDAKRFEESRVAFEETLEVRADDVEALFHLGLMASQDESTRPAALGYLKRYLAAGGDDPRVTEWVRDLEQR